MKKSKSTKKKVSDKSRNTILKINSLAAQNMRQKKGKKVSREYSWFDALKDAGKSVKSKLF